MFTYRLAVLTWAFAFILRLLQCFILPAANETWLWDCRDATPCRGCNLKLREDSQTWWRWEQSTSAATVESCSWARHHLMLHWSKYVWFPDWASMVGVGGGHLCSLDSLWTARMSDSLPLSASSRWERICVAQLDRFASRRPSWPSRRVGFTEELRPCAPPRPRA